VIGGDRLEVEAERKRKIRRQAKKQEKLVTYLQ
jgi:hypothetical protein